MLLNHINLEVDGNAESISFRLFWEGFYQTGCGNHLQTGLVHANMLMGIGFWPLFEPEQSTFNTSVLFYLFFMLIYLCFLLDIFCIFSSCSLDGKIFICVSRCFSCRRPDSFSPRWPDHSGRDPPAVDTR